LLLAGVLLGVVLSLLTWGAAELASAYINVSVEISWA
jgi:hypothetical protein